MTTPLRPRTAAGRRLLDNLAPDSRQNYEHGNVQTGDVADLRAAILAIEEEATEAVMADCQETATSEYQRGRAEAAPDLRAALERLLRMNDEVGEDMCPNCVTPWKCNGPHITPSERARAALAAPAADGLDVLRPENLVAERVIASGIADVVERRGEEWFDGMRARGEYLELATRILEEISRRAPNEPSREPGEEG